MSLSNPDSVFREEGPCQLSAGNRIDSGVEYITEQLLGWDNFFPESGSRKTHPSSHLHKSAVMYCCTRSVSENYIQLDRPQAKLYPSNFIVLIPGHERDINPPPPKA